MLNRVFCQAIVISSEVSITEVILDRVTGDGTEAGPDGTSRTDTHGFVGRPTLAAKVNNGPGEERGLVGCGA